MRLQLDHSLLDYVSVAFAKSTGVQMYIMLWSHAAAADIETADTFRREMYNLVGIPLPDLPAKKVLFWLRRCVNVYV